MGGYPQYGCPQRYERADRNTIPSAGPSARAPALDTWHIRNRAGRQNRPSDPHQKINVNGFARLSSHSGKVLAIQIRLITEDLPTLDLPAKITCGRPSRGKSSGRTAERTNVTRCTFIRHVTSLLCQYRTFSLFTGDVGFDRRGKIQCRLQHGIHALSQYKFSFSRTTGSISCRSLSFSAGMITVCMPWRKPAMVFSFSPPMGSTPAAQGDFPCHGHPAAHAAPVRAETTAVAMVTPADGPSLGTAASGKWMWISIV